MYNVNVISDEGVASGDQMSLSLSDVLAVGEDSTFQQLVQGRDLLGTLEFPDTLSQVHLCMYMYIV